MSFSIQFSGHAARENKSAATTAAFHEEMENLCKPYVDAFFRNLAHPQDTVPLPSLQVRDSANSSSGDTAPHGHGVKKTNTTTHIAATLSAPEALLCECSHLFEGAAHPVQTRSAAELEVENAYLRAVLSRMLLLQQQQPQRHYQAVSTSKDAIEPVQEEEGKDEFVSLLPSSKLSPARATHFDVFESRRSPSAACPEPIEQHPHFSYSGGTLHRVPMGRKAHAGVDARDASPATTVQVVELQEQIELLREAVRELSQQHASVARGTSASPLPADTRAVPFTLRAVSPSPRCATPTCTTDVPTLQRIILHQQQTIRTLQQEMEEVESAKMQIEQLLHLHEAAATADAASSTDYNDGAPISQAVMDAEEEEEGDTSCLLATTHWRSTCNTEDRHSGLTPVGNGPEATSYHHNPSDGKTDAVSEIAVNASHKTGLTALEEMYRMDYDAAAEAATERRRAATYGGAQASSWFDTTLSVDEPINLTDSGAAKEEDNEGDEVGVGDDEPSSGVCTPLPRRTVVLRPLQQRYSSATGDSSPVAGRPTDESPVMLPAKSSYGTASNRRTSMMGSPSGI